MITTEFVGGETCTATIHQQGCVHAIGDSPARPASPAPSVGEPVTPALINSLSQPLRDYIHELEARADPAGTVRELAQLRDTNEGLQRMYRRAADALAEVIGCFDAAAGEGLAEALAETPDERIKDLVERRLMYAHAAALNLATPPAAPAATEGVIQVKFEDNFLTEWSGSIPDGTYTLAAPAAAVPESPADTQPKSDAEGA